ncbi:MAG: serine hydrolase domain-containing protein [Promethearchaeota archaeon]
MKTNYREIKKKIDAFVIGIMKDRAVPGISLGIMKEGEIFYSRGYGYRNIHEELPMTPDTLYGIGSSSKSFVALAMMMLVEAGKIDLEAPVSDYIDFQIGLEGHPIKVKHILSHSSGVQDLMFGTIPFMWADCNYQWVFPMSNPNDYLTVVNSAKEFVRFPPEEQFMYNNDFYEVAGLVIQSQIEGTFEDFIINNIMRPLGMERSTYYKSDFLNDPMKDTMTGYAINPKAKKVVEKPFPFGKTINGPGAILSSANEMLKYLQMLLNKGTYNGKQIVSPAMIEKMWTGMIKCPYGQGENPQYGFGWGREEDFLDTIYIEHGGNVVASSNAMAVLPEKNIALILGQNMDNQLTTQMGRGICAIMLGEDPAKVIPNLSTIKKLRPILGRYADHASVLSVNVELVGPVLMATYTVGNFHEQKFPLIPIDLDQYVFKIAGILPVPYEIQFFIKEEKNEVFLKFDRNILFKK